MDRVYDFIRSRHLPLLLSEEDSKANMVGRLGYLNHLGNLLSSTNIDVARP